MKTLIGYVVKVGDEYAIGNACVTHPDREKAFVFPSNELNWAKGHMSCHKDGRIVRLYRVTKSDYVQKLNKLEERVFALELAKSQEPSRVAKLVNDEMFVKFSRLTTR